MLAVALSWTMLSGHRADAQALNQVAEPGRHALIVTVGTYLRKDLTPLPGTRHDRISALKMAEAMGIQPDNIVILTDQSATEQAITDALEQLRQRTSPGDRVYIHFSGHGTRGWDAQAAGCVEGFMAYDTQNQVKFTHTTLANLLTPIAQATDKLFVMYDACHSGGLTRSMPSRTRQLSDAAAIDGLRAKFASTDDRCAIPTNVKTRNLMVEQTRQGALPQDLVYLAAARPDEISFDDETKGGLATQAVRDCLLGEAVDQDSSRTIDITEIQHCAQAKIAKRLEGHEQFKPHHLVLQGNGGFVPVWFSRPGDGARPQVSFTAKQALEELHAQRTAKLDPSVMPASQRLRIGKDALSFSIQSPANGWVYVFGGGSDNETLDLLFPNARDQSNRIAVGESMQVPRSHWRMTAAGPAGTNKIWVVVTQAPIDLSVFGGKAKGTPLFVRNDPQARVQLAKALLERPASCHANTLCKTGFGSFMMDVIEE